VPCPEIGCTQVTSSRHLPRWPSLVSTLPGTTPVLGCREESDLGVRRPTFGVMGISRFGGHLISGAQPREGVHQGDHGKEEVTTTSVVHSGVQGRDLRALQPIEWVRHLWVPRIPSTAAELGFQGSARLRDGPDVLLRSVNSRPPGAPAPPRGTRRSRHRDRDASPRGGRAAPPDSPPAAAIKRSSTACGAESAPVERSPGSVLRATRDAAPMASRHRSTGGRTRTAQADRPFPQARSASSYASPERTQPGGIAESMASWQR
jgi:hypothetical protein